MFHVNHKKIEEERNEEEIKQYVEKISDYEKLIDGDQHRLLYEMLQGNGDAKETLAKAYLLSVYKTAETYQGRGLSLKELINAGNIGLLKGLEKFQTERYSSFAIYVAWWVKKEILHVISDPKKELDRKEEVIKKYNSLYLSFIHNKK